MAGKESIVFINQNAGYLMIDIIHAHTEYQQRAIITGKLVSRNKSLDDAVVVEKIITYNRSSGIKRLFTWFWGFVQILWLVKTKYRKSDLFIITNPPFAVFIPLFCNNKFSVLIYDIYPDALVAYKYISDHNIITRMWKRVNRKIFSKAQKIFTISNGMKKVLSAYVAENKICVVPIWTDNRFLKPVDKDSNIFIQQHQLQDKFIVMYSGNLGHSHSLELLVEMASAIKDKEIYFVVIGEGDKKRLLDDLLKKNKLANFILLPLQEIEMLPFSLSAADLAVVTLGKEASELSVPSKTFNLMSAGVPIMGIAATSSELASIIAHYQIGKCFSTTAVEEMIEFIQLVKSDKKYHSRLRQNALAASEDFSPANAFKFVAS